MRLAVLYTGGTIGSVGTPLGPLSDRAFQEAFQANLTPILESEYTELEIGFIPFGTAVLDSTNLRPSDWCKMAGEILTRYRDYEAFVVLHGTDTMAYSASALSFLMTGLHRNGYPNAVLSKPVIFTGSQVPLFYRADSSERLSLRFNTDAYQNVCGAVAAAHSGAPEVCLYFGNALFRGNRTRKTNASEFDAFSSPNYPRLGETGVSFELFNERVLHLPTTESISLESDGARERLSRQLDFIATHIDSCRVMPFLAFPAPYGETEDGAMSVLAELLSACVARKLDGVVLQSYGEGNFPSGNPDRPEEGAVFEALRDADAAGTILIDNTQVLSGVVNGSSYASGSWLSGVGVVGAYDMTPIAALTKLIYLKTLSRYGDNGWDQDAIKRLMQTNVIGEIMDVNRLDARGERFLAPDASIHALDGTASMVNDPDLGPVLRDRAGALLWAALSDPSGADMPGRLYMQGDGNAVFYDASNIVRWSSDTASTSFATSMLVLDGASSPFGLSLYVYDYARQAIEKTLFRA